MNLRVVEPGWHTLVVDFGRPFTRALGVPVSGAADRFSLALGNALVGNPPASAALEISLSGPTLVADCDLACVLQGAPFKIFAGETRLTPGKTFFLPKGVPLQIGSTETGMRAYLCIKHGIDQPVFLESRTALAPLIAGQKLRCRQSQIHARFIATDFAWNKEPRKLRAVDGPQADWFGSEVLFFQEYLITPSSNRMGLRLKSQPLEFPNRELVSEPVCPGSVQVTSDGQCIILGVDGQTIGGYPKIAQVITADLDKLGQLRPGESITFARVTLDQAKAIHLGKEKELQYWITRLMAAENFPGRPTGEEEAPLP